MINAREYQSEIKNGQSRETVNIDLVHKTKTNKTQVKQKIR